MTVLARYLSSSDNLAPAACRTASKSAENPANVIIRPANVYKKVAPLTSMFCSFQEPGPFWRVLVLTTNPPEGQASRRLSAKAPGTPGFYPQISQMNADSGTEN